MKKILSLIFLTGFILCFAYLTFYIFTDGKVNTYQIHKPAYEGYVCKNRFSLGEVMPLSYAQMGCPQGYIAASSTKKYIVVGTDNGRILLFDNQGNLKWEKGNAIDKIMSFSFMGEEHLLIGEEGPGAAVKMLEVDSGRELWRLNLGEYMLRDIENKEYSGVTDIKVDKNGEILVTVMSYKLKPRYVREYYSLLFSIGPNGTMKQRYPKDSYIEGYINGITVDNENSNIYLPLANYYDRLFKNDYSSQLYCIDKNLDKTIWRLKLEKVNPFRTAVIRTLPLVVKNHCFVLYGDGRWLYLTKDGFIKEQGRVIQADNMGDFFINATPVKLFLHKEMICFSTSNSHNTINSKIPVNVEQSIANSIFIFDENMQFKRRVKMQGMIGGRTGSVDFEQECMIVPVGMNNITCDNSVFGINCIDYMTGSEKFKIPLEGPCLAVMSTQNQKYIYAIEAPIKGKNGVIHGAYQLLIFEKRD